MFTFIYNTITRSIVVLLIAMLSVNYMPDNFFKEFPLEPKAMDPVDFDSVIPVWNDRLSSKELAQPEFIQLNNIMGPESLAISPEGLIYTGLSDGRLVELDPKNKYKMRQVLRFKVSPQCNDNDPNNADFCGRFLQVRFVNNTLYALEGTSGLYKIDIKSGTKSFLGPKNLRTQTSLHNSFAFDPKEPNLAYITYSSTKWSIFRMIWAICELDTSGMIVGLDINTGKSTVLIEDLLVPNGIDVYPKKDQLIFTQTVKGQVNYVDLQELRNAMKSKDKVSPIKPKVLIPVVPGNPDNIMVDGDSAYIALPLVKLNGKEFLDHWSTMPNVRKSFGRFLFGISKLFEYLDKNIYHHQIFENIYKDLYSGHIMYRILQSDKCAVIRYNLATGASNFYGSDTFGYVSEATPDGKGNVYLGSFRSPFIVKVKL